MRDEIERYHQAGVQPFGVNPAGIESHASYARKFRFPFPLLSDPDRRVADAYGALKPDGKGIIRSVVVVGTSGTVIFAERGAPTPDRVIRGVQAPGAPR